MVWELGMIGAVPVGTRESCNACVFSRGNAGASSREHGIWSTIFSWCCVRVTNTGTHAFERHLTVEDY